DVVAGGAAATVLARLGLDGDFPCRADCLPQLSRDAPLLAIGITAQRVLAAEARALRRLLVWIVDRRLGLEEVFQGQRMGLEEFPQREGLDGAGNHLCCSFRNSASAPGPCVYAH